MCAAISHAQTTRIRLMAANITSGNNQSYDPGEGIRIFQGLDPDIILIQEFKYGGNTTTDIRNLVDTAFGSSFQYFREVGGGIPNGVISRYPILEAGEWEDTNVSDREFVWAKIDVPGDKNLWAVSVHLLTSSSTNRNNQATLLKNFINNKPIPTTDYLVIGGDFNTDNRSEACVTTLSSLVVTAGPYPNDGTANSSKENTNAARAKPYDWVIANSTLNQYKTSTIIGSKTFASGLVFDSRVYTPLSEVSPVQSGDSGVTGMQHMGVVRDFLIPSTAATASPSPSPSATPSPSFTASISPSLTASPTESLTPSPTETATPSPTASISPSPSLSPTESPAPSPSATDTPTLTPSPTASLSPTASPSLTATSTPAATLVGEQGWIAR